jgi:hypothetical protein
MADVYFCIVRKAVVLLRTACTEVTSSRPQSELSVGSPSEARLFLKLCLQEAFEAGHQLAVLEVLDGLLTDSCVDYEVCQHIVSIGNRLTRDMWCEGSRYHLDHLAKLTSRLAGPPF